MAIRLQVFKGNDVVATHVLDGPIVKIGSMSGAQVCLDDTTVSRIHAVIEVDGGKATIVDLGHETGTLVNGAPVNKASLQSGDEIRIGAFRLVVNPPDGDALEDVGKRLSAIRDEALGLVEKGRDADAVALVCKRAGLAPAEAKAYVDGLRKR